MLAGRVRYKGGFAQWSSLALSIACELTNEGERERLLGKAGALELIRVLGTLRGWASRGAVLPESTPMPTTVLSAPNTHTLSSESKVRPLPES